VIRALAPLVIGEDLLRSEAVVARLHVFTRPSRGGLNHQAIAAIENALLDIRGKVLGVPVDAQFGGPIRESIPVHWSHCGSYRVRHSEMIGVKPLLTYNDWRSTRKMFATATSAPSRPTSCRTRMAVSSRSVRASAAPRAIFN
jgi:L-alanine-DL-glutamate epimerase-like enolase superfamily enzyme